MHAMNSQAVDGILRWVLAGFYIVIFIISVVQFLRFMVLLRSKGLPLKLYYGMLAATALARILQFTVFSFSSFEHEDTLLSVAIFVGSVLYFSTYIFLVFFWSESYWSISTSGTRRGVRMAFGALMALYYALCICFVVLMFELDLNAEDRFEVSVLGVAATSTISALMFLFFSMRLLSYLHRQDQFLTKNQRKSLRKICFIAVISAITFFLRAAFLYASAVDPTQVQGGSEHLEYEFYYYFVVEVLPTALMLFIVGTMSNEKIRKMNRAGMNAQSAVGGGRGGGGRGRSRRVDPVWMLSQTNSTNSILRRDLENLVQDESLLLSNSVTSMNINQSASGGYANSEIAPLRPAATAYGAV